MPPLPSSPLLALERDLLDDAAGFASWRAHLVDEHGNGAVVSWGFGQPLARLAGEPALARQVPSLSLLVFSLGAPSLWLHQRFPEDQAAWQEPAGRWRFGSTQVEALRDLKAQVVIARVDCALPGTKDPLVGHVEMGGVPRRVESGREEREGADADANESWSPLMGFGQGRAILSVGRQHHFHLQGRAYHQRHGRTGALPSEVAFVGEGHIPFADQDVSFQVHLDASGRGRATGIAVDVEGRGRAVELSAETEGPPGRFSKLILRQGDDKWLEATTEHVAHERLLERTCVVRARAPMSLPAVGLIEWQSADEGEQRRLAAKARRYVHVVGQRSPLGVRLESGPVRDRWRRGFSLR